MNHTPETNPFPEWATAKHIVQALRELAAASNTTQVASASPISISASSTPAETGAVPLAANANVQQVSYDAIQIKFEEYHRRHPEIYDYLVAAARSIKAKGFTEYGLRTIWEKLRWHLDMHKDEYEEYMTEQVPGSNLRHHDLFHQATGAHWIDLADGYVLLCTDFSSEWAEETFHAHPEVARLAHPTMEGNIPVGDLHSKPDHGHKQFKHEHMKALNSLGIQEHHTIWDIHKIAKAIHPNVRLSQLY
jgi:hypothetical protein